MGFLKDKVAIVTGAGQGVGEGIALALAAEGARVALVGKTRAKLERTAAQIGARGGTSLIIDADIKSPAEVGRIVAEALDAWGTVDILVNNAMEYALGRLLDVPDEILQASWESGPIASLRLMKACHPHLCGGGVVVNVSSPSSVNPNPVGKPLYSMIKATINSLTRVAAVEWGADGIRVLGIMPTANSPAVEQHRIDYPEVVAEALTAIPLHRFADPETEIGNVVAFLCGPSATYITGTTIPLDGGIAYLR